MTQSAAPGESVTTAAQARPVKKALFSQAALYGVMSALSLSIPALLAPILTHYLTPEDYGLIVLFDILMQCIGPLVGIGTQSAIRRRYFDYDRSALSSYVMSCVRVVSSLHGVLLVVLLAIVPFARVEALPDNRWLLVLVPWLFAQYVISLATSFFQLEQKPIAFGSVQGGVTATDLLSSLLFVIVFGWGWRGRIVGQVFANSCFALVSLFLLARRVSFTAPGRAEFARDAASYGLPTVPYSILERLIALTDRLLLVAFATLASAGTYALGAQVAGLLMLATTGFALAWQPWMFARLKANTPASRREVARAFALAAGLLALGATGIALLSPIVLPLIIGKKFLPVIPLIPWLAAGFCCRGISRIMSDVIMFEGRTFVLSKITIVGLILNAGGNLLLVPRYGALGAAISTSAAFAFTAAMVGYASLDAWKRLASRPAVTAE
jgi:O-antigen/teichoic acid export membrane protein